MSLQVEAEIKSSSDATAEPYITFCKMLKILKFRIFLSALTEIKMDLYVNVQCEYRSYKDIGTQIR